MNNSVSNHYKTNLQRCTVGYTGIYACGVSYKREFTEMYRRLYGNLRLWSVIQTVVALAKSDTMKQEFSQYGYICPYFE